MIAHTTLPVSDYKLSKKFYKKVLAPLGYKINMETGEAGGFFDGKNRFQHTIITSIYNPETDSYDAVITAQDVTDEKRQLDLVKKLKQEAL